MWKHKNASKIQQDALNWEQVPRIQTIQREVQENGHVATTVLRSSIEKTVRADADAVTSTTHDANWKDAGPSVMMRIGDLKFCSPCGTFLGSDSLGVRNDEAVTTHWNQRRTWRWQKDG